MVHPDGAARIESFEYEPWPRWRFRLADELVVEQELFVRPGESAVYISWRVIEGGTRAKLKVWPFFSGRDFHSTHHENGAFRFDAEQEDERVRFQPYDGLPAVIAQSNSRYTSQPDWYRNFLYSEEQARGLDAIEDLAAPGVFEFDLSKPAVLMLAADGHTHQQSNGSVETRYAGVRASELHRRKGFPSLLHRAADAYLVRRGSGKTIIAGYPWFGDWGRDTPRIGKPVEVQALWLNALAIAAQFSASWQPIFDTGRRSFEERFWDPDGEFLYDVVDCDHQPGTADRTFRPNQIFAVGGLPLVLLPNDKARKVVDALEERLLTPLGLRSLAPGEQGYIGHYGGGVAQRDGSYHQGTVWPWLIGPFVEAWLRVRDNSAEAKKEAAARFVMPLLAHLNHAGLGHISEIADADAPHQPAGCPFQAWSLGELLRLDAVL